eukprot:scaffold2372_cov198-Alexandrium_tamarense.AAC.7
MSYNSQDLDLFNAACELFFVKHTLYDDIVFRPKRKRLSLSQLNSFRESRGMARFQGVTKVYLREDRAIPFHRWEGVC